MGYFSRTQKVSRHLRHERTQLRARETQRWIEIYLITTRDNHQFSHQSGRAFVFPQQFCIGGYQTLNLYRLYFITIQTIKSFCVKEVFHANLQSYYITHNALQHKPRSIQNQRDEGIKTQITTWEENFKSLRNRVG